MPRLARDEVRADLGSPFKFFFFLFYGLLIMIAIGIQPPGYEERRRERIKETYGFEINPVKATVEGSQ